MIERDKGFIQGIVVSLDLVALHGQETLFEEIVEACGKKDVLKELSKNGSDASKELANRMR